MRYEGSGGRSKPSGRYIDGKGSHKGGAREFKLPSLTRAQTTAAASAAASARTRAMRGRSDSCSLS